MHKISLIFGTIFVSAISFSAQAKTICTTIAEPSSGKTLLAEGDCETRVTPASTFKIPLAVIGFDSDYLKGANEPVLNIKKGDPDWGGDNWKRPTDPTSWLKYSVVWYSQRITHAVGEKKLKDYVSKLDYGNADISGDAGKNNGLDRSWIASSLKISPQEQIAFLNKLVNRKLQVSADAMNKTAEIVEVTQLANGWRVHGKTGGAFPRKADGKFDYTRGWGWFVGWVENGKDTYTFARLIQDEKKNPISPGLRAKEAILKELPELLAKLPK